MADTLGYRENLFPLLTRCLFLFYPLSPAVNPFSAIAAFLSRNTFPSRQKRRRNYPANPRLSPACPPLLAPFIRLSEAGQVVRGVGTPWSLAID